MKTQKQIIHFHNDFLIGNRFMQRRMSIKDIKSQVFHYQGICTNARPNRKCNEDITGRRSEWIFYVEVANFLILL